MAIPAKKPNFINAVQFLKKTAEGLEDCPRRRTNFIRGELGGVKQIFDYYRI
jgi:hypothetical protein